MFPLGDSNGLETGLGGASQVTFGVISGALEEAMLVGAATGPFIL